MPSLDIFNDNAFTVQSLTDAINDTPYKPGRIGQLGYFDEKGISTTSISIERKGLSLNLVPSSQRGAPGNVVNGDKRTMVAFPSVHLQDNATIMADEVQNVRAFGEESETQLVQSIVNERLEKMRNRMDVTLEFQRIGAIKGQVLDADGSTVLMDMFNTFGLTQQTQVMSLATASTKLKTKILSAMKKVENVLGGLAPSGYRVLAGESFWEEFMSHDNVEKSYDRWLEGEFLRQDPRNAFSFGGVKWERYVGKVDGIDFVGVDDAYLVPEGVMDMFLTKFAPADYMETVNTLGRPYYSKQEILRMNKGVELESQSNPITICTRPDAIIKLTK